MRTKTKEGDKNGHEEVEEERKMEERRRIICQSFGDSYSSTLKKAV